MLTEHKPVFPRKEFWKCSCGRVNFYGTHTCIQCGKSETMATYSDPCARCSFKINGKKAEEKL